MLPNLIVAAHVSALILFECLAATAAERVSFGADTRGGNSGERVVVTSLADSGPGTLRQAVQKGQRTITFQISGTITLKSPLVIRQPELTIDGSSAPAPGITITARPVVLQDTRDVILRHLRFRDSDDDNLRLVGACRNMLVEHCSSTRAGDGAIDITLDYKTGERPRDVTIAWCLIGGTEKAMLIQSVSRVSLHHNLFTNNGQRQPQLHDVREFDVRNNVVRHWTVYGVRVRAGSTGNIVHNVFSASSNRNKSPNSALVLVGSENGADAAAGEVYTHGNIAAHGLEPNRLGRASRALAAPELRTDDAADVLASVLEKAGARPLDATDREFLQAGPELKPRPATTD